MDVRANEEGAAAQIPSIDVANGERDVLDWGNLIPTPPTRPGGRIKARLKKAPPEQPASAEDPWAK